MRLISKFFHVGAALSLVLASGCAKPASTDSAPAAHAEKAAAPAAAKPAEKKPAADKPAPPAAAPVDHAAHEGHADHAGHAHAAPADHAGHAHAAPAAAPADHAGHAKAPAADVAKKDFGLKKDGDKRWQMDAHTRVAMAKIAKIVVASPVLAAVEPHHTLGAKLQAELKVLVRGCTMDGPNHDMLHVYLSALFPRVGVIAKGTELPALQKALAETKKLTAAYPVYFE